MQTLLVILLFTVALGWLGWKGYQSLFQKKAGCGKGCGCADDVSKNSVLSINTVQKIKQ